MEVFGFIGGYAHGNLLISLQNSPFPEQAEWRPQSGAGVLMPLGRNWGVLLDLSSSTVDGYYRWDGLPGAGPGDNSIRNHRLTLAPSLVRLWRRDRFSVYAGFGPAVEHDREKSRFRKIVDRDEMGRPVLAEGFTDGRVNRTHVAPLGFRIGVIASPGERFLLRSGYSYHRRYADWRGSQGLEAGIGYRF